VPLKLTLEDDYRSASLEDVSTDIDQPIYRVTLTEGESEWLHVVRCVQTAEKLVNRWLILGDFTFGPWALGARVGV
jgi:hypothetical protein